MLLAALLLLNLFDAVLTLFWVTTGLTTEENPLMAIALAYHPIAFVSAKLSLVGLAVFLLHRFRRRQSVRLASWLLAGLYYWIALAHAWFYGAVVIPAFF
ncbi:MAG: hypothetical protein FJ125_09920 [Deltaproteobacteria bacterium]|nr:hypothetical protein [Deltaproteobacteria bacterium]